MQSQSKCLILDEPYQVGTQSGHPSPPTLQGKDGKCQQGLMEESKDLLLRRCVRSGLVSLPHIVDSNLRVRVS